MDDAIVSFYNNVYDKNSKKTMHALEVLQGIIEGDWKVEIDAIRASKNREEKDALKRNLAAATFSGTFSKRNEKCLIEYNGLVTIDIDDVKNAQALKSKAMKDPYLAMAFISPSGGLKLFYRTDLGPELHKDCVYPQIKDRVQRLLRVKCDTSGKDYSRLCFVSYDPDAYYNDSYQSVPVDPNRRPDIEKEAQYSGVQTLPNGTAPSYDQEHIFKVCKMWTKKRFSFRKGSRNNYIHYLACNMNRAGVPKEITEMLIIRDYPSLAKEIPLVVKGVFIRNAGEHGTVTIWKNVSYQKELLTFDYGKNANI